MNDDITDGYNFGEKRVLEVLRTYGPLTIREIARKGFPGVRPITKADSHVRNGLRRPRARKEVRKIARGKYKAL